MTQTQTQPAASDEPAPEDWGPGEERGAILRLALIVAIAVGAAIVTDVAKTVAVVFALILMIMLHELGHFLTAKWSGMKVTEYFLGFGPRLWSVRRGETEYGIKAVPLGGYVKIIGMSNIDEVPPEDETRTYRQKGYWRRLSVAVAGSTMHFIIAFALLWGLFAFVGRPNEDKLEPVVDELSRLETGPSPAEAAGFKPGDRVLAVDGDRITDWKQVRDHIRAKPDQDIAFTVRRGDQRVDLRAHTVDLQKITVKGVPAVDRPTGFMGISGGHPVVEKYGVIGSLGHAGTQLGSISKTTVVALGKLFSAGGVRGYVDQVSGKKTDDPNAPRFLSPVGFVRVAGQAADAGWAPTLLLLALINVFVGIFNMMPLPPFDGGHVAVATYEAIRSRKGRRYYVDGRKVIAVATPVLVVLFTIFATSLFIDVVRPAANPFR